MRHGPIVTCACGCGSTGHNEGNGYITSCYDRWRGAGYPKEGPPPARPKTNPWRPTGPRGAATLALYGQLVDQRATQARIRREIGLSDRQILRYAAAWRAQQESEANQ
ncbi:hypothetical protein [Microbispora rosea]|uniref:hypothetical protein n=1 Tax=Microbispora rosea TaxID=58117 RepID=UPI00378A604D